MRTTRSITMDPADQRPVRNGATGRDQSAGFEAANIKTIRPGIRALVPPGLGAALLVGAIVAGSISGGGSIWVWLMAPLLLGLYGGWCWMVRRRVIRIAADGLESQSAWGSSRRVLWRDIQRSEVTSWTEPPPMRLRVFVQAGSGPVLDLPLWLYAPSDIDHLLGLRELRLGGERSSCPEL